MANFAKNWRPSRSEAAPAQLAGRVDELRSALRLHDPEVAAARSGVSYRRLGPGQGELQIPLWDKACVLAWPELTGLDGRGAQLPDFQLALLLYYLNTADGAPLTGKWVSFADLPGGRMYNAAFQGYSGDEVIRAYEPGGRPADPVEPESDPIRRFQKACLACGGQPVEIGSAAFVFQALPRVPLLITYWLGDEDFPSSCKVLFDAAVCHYLPIDACAILGSILVQKLLHS